MNALAVLLSYLIGSVPTGLWLGLWFKGIDVRRHGSGNIGATNTFRALGKGFGIATLVLDAAKGAVPVLLVSRLGTWHDLPLICGMAAVLGHTFSAFLKFKGGKGVATGAGAFLALSTIPTLIAAAVFGAVFAATRMVSAGSLAGAAALACGVLATAHDWPIRVVALVLAALIFWKHRANIRRIIQGAESKI